MKEIKYLPPMEKFLLMIKKLVVTLLKWTTTG